VIYRSVTIFGEWAKEESEFLASLCQQRLTLLDLGANVGLVARQVLNMTHLVGKVIAVEPRERTVQNLKLNLNRYLESQGIELEFCQFALGKFDDSSTLYTERGNIGNSSLHEHLAPDAHLETVEIMSSGGFYNNYLDNNERYILKSDLQGMDAAVLSSLPLKFWDRVIGAVIEVWPNKHVNFEEVTQLSQLLIREFNCSFNPSFSDILHSDQLEDYWTNSSNKAQNLYIKKTS
jgi:FkbM family methyltransferase